MALTRSVVDIVLEEAEKDMFDGLFAYLARGTVAEHAKLSIVRMPVVARCNACRYVFHPNLRGEGGRAAETPVCPACRRRDFGLVSGMEFRVDHIDMVGLAATVDAGGSEGTAPRRVLGPSDLPEHRPDVFVAVDRGDGLRERPEVSGLVASQVA